MNEVRNQNGKLVCCIDETRKSIVIKLKGCTTIIIFNDDGTATIIER